LAVSKGCGRVEALVVRGDLGGIDAGLPGTAGCSCRVAMQSLS